jgi:hypothetical protein
MVLGKITGITPRTTKIVDQQTFHRSRSMYCLTQQHQSQSLGRQTVCSPNFTALFTGNRRRWWINVVISVPRPRSRTSNGTCCATRRGQPPPGTPLCPSRTCRPSCCRLCWHSQTVKPSPSKAKVASLGELGAYAVSLGRSGSGSLCANGREVSPSGQKTSSQEQA